MNVTADKQVLRRRYYYLCHRMIGGRCTDRLTGTLLLTNGGCHGFRDGCQCGGGHDILDGFLFFICHDHHTACCCCGNRRYSNMFDIDRGRILIPNKKDSTQTIFGIRLVDDHPAAVWWQMKRGKRIPQQKIHEIAKRCVVQFM